MTGNVADGLKWWMIYCVCLFSFTMWIWGRLLWATSPWAGTRALLLFRSMQSLSSRARGTWWPAHRQVGHVWPLCMNEAYVSFWHSQCLSYVTIVMLGGKCVNYENAFVSMFDYCSLFNQALGKLQPSCFLCWVRSTLKDQEKHCRPPKPAPRYCSYKTVQFS